MHSSPMVVLRSKPAQILTEGSRESFQLRIDQAENGPYRRRRHLRLQLQDPAASPTVDPVPGGSVRVGMRRSFVGRGRSFDAIRGLSRGQTKATLFLTLLVVVTSARQDYLVEGTAAGPVTGTFTETGQVVFGPQVSLRTHW